MSHSEAQSPVDESPAARPSGRRTAAIAAITAATLGIVGVGAYAAVGFLGAGPQAEKAIPSTAVAVASIDLDPGASQKVEAIKTLRKFPEFRKATGIESRDDLRKAFFDEALKDGSCKGVSYDQDIKPWIGDSAAVAAVPFGKTALSPVVALGVKDQDKARAGLKTLLKCSDSGAKTGFAFDDGFAVISDTQAHADAAVEQATSKSITADAGYQEWTGKAGDRGIVNFYVAKAAAGYLADKAGDLTQPGGFPSGLPSGMPSHYPGSCDPRKDGPCATPGLPGQPGDEFTLPGEPSTHPSPLVSSGQGASAPYSRSSAARGEDDPQVKALKNFQGAAGALRFADGGLELGLVGGLGESLAPGAQGGDLVTGLPSDTSAALGIAIPKDFVANLLNRIGDLNLPLVGSGDQLEGLLEQQLGLSLPGDLQDLLGDGVALSVGGTAPADMSALRGPQDLQVGLSIAGDEAKVKKVIGKLESRAGALGASGVSVQGGDGRVALSLDADYAKQLAGKGDLGGKDAFSTVVPEADKASAVVYVDFNSVWRAAIAKAMSGTKGKELLANTEPLKAAGLSTWVDDGTTHVLLKITTD